MQLCVSFRNPLGPNPALNHGPVYGFVLVGIGAGRRLP